MEIILLERNPLLGRRNRMTTMRRSGVLHGASFGDLMARWMISASFKAVSDVVSAGFKTTVFPVTSAGAIFQAAISNGKFQGIICPATPSGRGFRLGKA